MKIKAIDVRALVSDKDCEIVRQASDKAGARLSVLEGDSAASDIIAMSTDLIVIDPAMISVTDWDRLCKWFNEYPFFGSYFLLAGPCPYAAAMPETRVIHELISVEGVTRAIRRVEAITSVFICSLSYDELLLSISDRIQYVKQIKA